MAEKRPSFGPSYGFRFIPNADIKRAAQSYIGTARLSIGIQVRDRLFDEGRLCSRSGAFQMLQIIGYRISRILMSELSANSVKIRRNIANHQYMYIFTG